MSRPCVETWVFYADPEQIPVPKPGAMLAALSAAGVRVVPLDGGVLAAFGPASWFAGPGGDRNRLELRRRVRALAEHLGGGAVAGAAPLLARGGEA
jgi:hypothetical protein